VHYCRQGRVANLLSGEKCLAVKIYFSPAKSFDHGAKSQKQDVAIAQVERRCDTIPRTYRNTFGRAGSDKASMFGSYIGELPVPSGGSTNGGAPSGPPMPTNVRPKEVCTVQDSDWTGQAQPLASYNSKNCSLASADRNG
jgi:hypothetical protein